MWIRVIFHRVDGVGRRQFDFHTACRPLARHALAVVLVDRRFFLVLVLDVLAATAPPRLDLAVVLRHPDAGLREPVDGSADRDKHLGLELLGPRLAPGLELADDRADAVKLDLRVEPVDLV